MLNLDVGSLAGIIVSLRCAFDNLWYCTHRPGFSVTISMAICCHRWSSKT